MYETAPSGLISIPTFCLYPPKFSNLHPSTLSLIHTILIQATIISNVGPTFKGSLWFLYPFRCFPFPAILLHRRFLGCHVLWGEKHCMTNPMDVCAGENSLLSSFLNCYLCVTGFFWLIFSVLSKIIHVSSVDVIKEKLKTSQVHILDNCGHALSLERPWKTAKLMMQFYKSIESQ